MKSYLVACLSIGLAAATSSGALACSFHNDVSAEAPMTPIVTAEFERPGDGQAGPEAGEDRQREQELKPVRPA